MSRRRPAAALDLEAMVAGGKTSAYEAFELYKGKANRFKIKGDYAKGLEVLSTGAASMATNSYFTCAEELCHKYVAMLAESKSELTPEVRAAICSIDAAFAEQDHAARHAFLAECVSWSTAIGTRRYGDPQLQSQLGQCLWARKEIRKSLHHFAAGEAPGALWSVVEDNVSAWSDNKMEETVALGVLHFLALQNLRDANELWRKYVDSEKGVSSRTGLKEFIGYLLRTCERDAAPLFKTLCGKYAKDFEFDSAASNLLHGPIATKLFNIQSAPSGGMFSMIQELMGGGGGGGGMF
jgi:hypothetical protein